jgi:hypothetical protein
LERGSVPAADFEDKMFEQNVMDDPFHQPSDKSSKPLIAGILLMIAGGLSILMWLSLAAIDVSFIETFIMPELGLAPEYESIALSAESIKELFVICGTVGFFLSVFAILGGIMSVRRQLWGLVLAGGILGLFTIGPVFISSILSLIAIILVAISRKEFQ